MLTPTEQPVETAAVASLEVPVEEKVLIREITLRNILSFGPQTKPIPLRGLNVLIGPNGSGKSNLIEVIALLRATPGDMERVIRRGGGLTEWIWKGDQDGVAGIEVVLNTLWPWEHSPLRHTFEFDRLSLFDLRNESIEAVNRESGFFYRNQEAHRVIKGQGKENEIALDHLKFENGFSILAQMADPVNYGELTYLATAYKSIRIYREWTFGHNAVFRTPQKADMRNDRLEEDFSNLGLFLNKLRRNPIAKRAILSALADFYDGFSDFDVSIEGGGVQVFFTEGDFTIPATRLSDGTLRYLCLLAILCDPNPPPLICIEEPELGVHPDILHKLAELLISASQRTQLIVTTHSDYLVDAMTNRPEAIVICEKYDGQTEMKRLDEERMAIWLEKYRLGELWTSGELGGTRW